MAFEKELAAYKKELPNLLEQEGKYAVISGDSVIAIMDTYADALKEGYGKFGLDEEFMVKQIQSVEPIKVFTRDIRAVCR